MNNAEDKKTMKLFGQHLRRLRDAKGMSMEEFANTCDMEKSQVYRIENGKTNPSLTTLNELAAGLGIKLSELVEY
ncbi:helix-turn-helix domain-containing protein [Parasediminibacterium sp. JCM 36343]|uniref:helix-turn-helix domain-containing protein n=1 Tax=Parasediminibacterium sp. JCM 36343 TaxID=3374279 RepID=UPI00397D02CC